MKVSIVIPVYNEEDTIGACLEAIARQTIRPAEVTVVDNNSSDNTLALAAKYDFVTIISEPRQGVVHARSKGFDQATGDIIARLDADTILPENWIENVQSVYSEAGEPRLFAATASSDFRNFPHFFWSLVAKLTYFWPARLLLGHTTLVGSDMFLTKRLWQLVREEICQRNDVHEDMDLALHIGKVGAAIEYRAELKASVLARKRHVRVFSYPWMQLKIKLVSH